MIFCIPADLTIWKSDNRQSPFCRCFLRLIASLKACWCKKAGIFGDIELHFSDNRLTQIRADFQPDAALSGGRWVKLNPWFFANGCLDVYAVIQRLVQRNIDFIKTETHTNLILQLQSGVELIFEKCRGMQLASFRKQKASLPHWARETAS